MQAGGDQFSYLRRTGGEYKYKIIKIAGIDVSVYLNPRQHPGYPLSEKIRRIENSNAVLILVSELFQQVIHCVLRFFLPDKYSNKSQCIRSLNFFAIPLLNLNFA